MVQQALAAHEAISKLTSRELSVRELLSGYLEKIAKLEDRVGAWAYFNRDSVLEQAGKIEELAESDKKMNFPLFGIPVGVKDIFDTADMPTENGTVAQQGRQPERDASTVKILRDAGAIIMGKTVTAELAVVTPGKTTNPFDPARTPGGSSSGSAAAVAAGMVPLAIGTQTNGSVIRPASYCGVVGYKPTFGTISREGVLKQSPSLDQVGVFAGNVRDAALLAGVLRAGGRRNISIEKPRKYVSANPGLRETKRAVQPKFAFIKSPVWNEATIPTQQACMNFIKQMGEDVDEIDLPPLCDNSIKCHRTIMLYEMARNYQTFYDDHYAQISKELLDMVEEGRQISLAAYQEADETAMAITDMVDIILSPYDAVLTPATPSEAPTGLESTGSPIFCTIWSLCGVPAISLPVLRGEDNMPLGLQLVGARGMDEKLLESAGWIEHFYNSTKVD